MKRIRKLGDPVLRGQSSPVGDPTSPRVAELARDLRDTLIAFRRENGFGRGIAAPQVGVAERLIVIDAPNSAFSAALVNPEITRRSREEVLVWDFCFSLPGLVVEVRRWADVTVEYSDLDGVRRTVEVAGDLSELLQHEIDHLYGILALDRAATRDSVWSKEEWDLQRRVTR